MLKTTLFRKQLAILLLVTIIFAGAAMFISDIAVRAMISWSVQDDTTGGPTQGFVRLIDELTADGKITLDDAAEKVDRALSGHRMHGVRVVDKQTLEKEIGVDPLQVPEDPFHAFTKREKELRLPRVIVFRAKSDPARYIVFERNEMPGGGGFPPPPPGLGFGGPPPEGPPPGFPPPPPGEMRPGGTRVRGAHFIGGPRPPPIFIWTFAALILSGFLAAAISLFLLFSSMRRKARQAADVIKAIKQGDWQKRMPIDGVDEVGHLMQEFNRMADEIESAVRAMQRAEASRTSLLQELAHDLRTPIASLRGLIETLEMRNASLDTKARGELFSLAQKEIDYFARLVEDLLFLAQVRDPRYLNSGTSVDVAQVLRDQISRTDAEGKVVVWLRGLPPGPLSIRGDEVLLKRMIRNAIDNAVSFAKNEISVDVQILTAADSALAPHKTLRIAIRDDGPGFTPQALSTFGEKRFSRFLGPNEGERLSVGLGSVIMSTVAHVHGGTVEARNIDEGSRRRGAEVVLQLPLT